MARPVMLFTADWHIHKFDRVWYRRDELYGDTAYGIQQVVDIATTHDVPNVALLGDLFDQKPQQSDALQVMRRALDNFEALDCSVYFIQGQHELSSPPLLSAFHSWPDWIHNKRVQIGSLVFYGLDYQHPTEVRAALEAVPTDVDILLTHQVWRDFLGEERGDAWFHWVPAEVGTIISGDFHRTVSQHQGDRKIISPGPICMQNIGEPADKYVYIIDEALEFTQVQLKSRKYFDARITTDDELDELVDTWADNPARQLQQNVPAHIAKNIMRVWYRADLADARSRIEATMGRDVHLFLSPVAVEEETVAVDVQQRQQAVLTGGLEGCLNAFYRDNPHVHEDAVRLVRATTPLNDELTNIFKDRMTHGFDPHGEGSLQGQDND